MINEFDTKSILFLNECWIYLWKRWKTYKIWYNFNALQLYLKNIKSIKIFLHKTKVDPRIRANYFQSESVSESVSVSVALIPFSLAVLYIFGFLDFISLNASIISSIGIFKTIQESASNWKWWRENYLLVILI